MPFDLKNAGVTYQRAIINLSHDMMHKEVKVYVENMIAKSKKGKNHFEVLRKLFKRLREFQLKLNHEKYMLEVTSRKLLGFVVNQQGVKVDLEVKAILELPPPRPSKEVRGILGHLNYIA